MSLYTAIIIEPRCHRAFEFVINNFLNGLSNDWNIIIFHGIDNEKFIINIIKKLKKDFMKRITLINLNIKNLSINDYNNLLVSKNFYEKIPTDIFMIFQTDTLILNKEKINNFLDYDYVGAPWAHKPLGENVGNGGLSIRRKNKMLEIIENVPYSGRAEDLYFSHYPDKINKPSRNKACEFSVETIFFDKPFGCHKPWNRYYTKKFFKLYPSVYKLYKLNIAM